MIRPALLFIACIASAFSGCKAAPEARASPAVAQRSPAGLQLLSLEVRGDGRVHRFTVEVAQSWEEQAKGLMFRPTLGEDEGMVFPFDTPRPVSFWMKNTMIPLDLLFIREDGSIARIAANAVPYSLDPIRVGEPVAAVLEIAGGRAAKLGITEGNHVTWPGGPRP